MEILVFKTNLKFKKNIPTVVPVLNNLKGIIKWNFDLSDKDKILRVQAVNLSPRVVETSIRDLGYYCQELE